MLKTKQTYIVFEISTWTKALESLTLEKNFARKYMEKSVIWKRGYNLEVYDMYVSVKTRKMEKVEICGQILRFAIVHG